MGKIARAEMRKVVTRARAIKGLTDADYIRASDRAGCAPRETIPSDKSDRLVLSLGTIAGNESPRRDNYRRVLDPLPLFTPNRENQVERECRTK